MSGYILSIMIDIFKLVNQFTIFFSFFIYGKKIISCHFNIFKYDSFVCWFSLFFEHLKKR